MLYKKRIIADGVEYLIAVNIADSGTPTSNTEASVGMLYMDTDTGEMYKCTSAVNGVYTWKNIGNFGEITLTSPDGEGAYFNAEDGNAVITFYGTHGDEAVILRNIATPIGDRDVANKVYVDGAVSKAKTTIAQEAGESTSLVMSQKAVTDLVSEALGTSGTTEYETVDSVEQMTDTSKSYVLSTTGTIWAYGEAGQQPTWTKNYADLTDTTDNNWVLGWRLNSSGVAADASTWTPVPMVSNYVACAVGDVVRVKGLTLGGSNCAIYNSSKAVMTSAKPTFPSSDANWEMAMEGTDVYKFTAKSSNTGFMRFGGVPVGSVNDIIITVNEEIAYTTGYAWYDTELEPSASGGGNYVDLLVKVNENKANIEEVSDRVTALETGNGSVTIPSFWKDAVDVCVSKIKALQVNRNCVTFPFFSDNHTRDGKTQYMGMLIAHIMKECGIPYCFCGGDVITSAIASTADSDAEFKAQAKAFDEAMSYVPNGRFFMALGNHETVLKQDTSIEGSTTVTYDRNQQYEIFLRNKGTAQNMHFGGDGTYYYVNDVASKVRWIILNTNGIDDSNIDDTQLSWFENTALNFTESGWGVVIISHIPISNHYEQSNIGNNTDVIDIVKRYKEAVGENQADIIGWYSGHIHRDRIYTGVSVNDTDDTEGEDMGFTQVTITSDHTGIAYPIGDSPTYHPVANDNQSHAIDFVTINKGTRTVNITRLGIGEDRSYTY